MSDAARHELMYVKETTYGTTPSTPEFKILRNTGTTVGLSKSTYTSQELRPDRQIADFRHGIKTVGGNISCELNFQDLSDILSLALHGAWDDDELKCGVSRQSMSLLRHFTDQSASENQYHLFTGVEVSTLNVTIPVDGIVTAEFGVIGKGTFSTANGAPAGSTFATRPTNRPFTGTKGSVQEGGQDIAIVTELTLSLDNGMTARNAVGSEVAIDEASIGQSNLTGQVTCYFKDASLLKKFVNEEGSSLLFTLEDPEGNKLNFSIPKLSYTGGQPDISGPGDILLTMPFQAVYDPSTGSNLLITREEAE